MRLGYGKPAGMGLRSGILPLMPQAHGSKHAAMRQTAFGVMADTFYEHGCLAVGESGWRAKGKGRPPAADALLVF